MLNLLIKWLLSTLALLLIAWIIPGIGFTSVLAALGAALVIGIINVFIRPLFIFLTLPINLITLGLFTFIINALIFWLASTIVSGFIVTGFLVALLGSIIYSILSLFIDRINL